MKTEIFTSHAVNRSQYYFFLLTAFAWFIAGSLNAQDVLMGLTTNGGPEGKGTAYSIKTDTKAFNVIKSFADWGTNPDDDLIKGSDGALYGMTGNGGIYGFGTLFKITTSGELTVLKHFDLSVDGGYPKGSLVQANDGNFYGTLTNGTSKGGGAIFKITPSGQYNVIRSLSLSTDGGRPNGKLIQATDGYLYGTTYTGGSGGGGTIFRMNTSGTEYTVIKALTAATGLNPYGGLVQGTDGALYGMTRLGGTANKGVIFRVNTSGTAYTVLRSLTDPDGFYPMGDLIQATDGYLYGMAPNGGANNNGTIFRIKPAGTDFKVMRSLSVSIEGSGPTGSLVQASDGNFYGMAYGLNGGYSGSLFRMTLGGLVTVIKKLTGNTEGAQPKGGLVQGSDGALYGMTYAGGKYTYGTVIRITTANAFSVLAHLNGAAMGNVPLNNLAIGKDSTFYGVAQNGGAYNYGTVFKICGGTTTVVKSFNRLTDGALPAGGLLRGSDGNMYGTTTTGGTNGGGTIFKITPTGAFAVIRHLKSTTDGSAPKGTLVQGPDGYLYGTTSAGGPTSNGTIFKINTAGTDFKVLRAFVVATDGSKPETGLVFKDSVFYGITGTSPRFFKINSLGYFTVLKAFASTADGSAPAGSLIIGTDGAFYGTMFSGGSFSRGTIFRITTAGVITNLRHLNGTTDGGYPKGGLVQGSDGAFYGTTQSGGATGYGVVYRITTAKAFSVLHSFNIVTDGGTPQGGLIIAPKITLVANAQTGLTTNEDVAKAITLTGSGATNLTYTIITQPRNGTVTSGTGAARTYTPRTNFAGKDSFAFVTNLGCLASAPAWVKITMNPVNDVPVLTISNKTVVKGTLLTFTVTASDPDAGQTKTFALITPPSGATINATTGVFNWTPATTGTFTLKVRVTDNGSPVLYSEKTFTVTVTASTVAATTATNRSAVNEEADNRINAKTTLHPNPVRNRFTVILPTPVQQALVTIADIKGTVVFSQIQAVSSQQLNLDASTFKPGAYFLQLQTTRGTEVLKFIKLQ